MQRVVSFLKLRKLLEFTFLIEYDEYYLYK